jgi:hypothetical protein
MSIALVGYLIHKATELLDLLYSYQRTIAGQEAVTGDHNLHKTVVSKLTQL